MGAGGRWCVVVDVDRDTTWPAAYEFVRRGYDEGITYKIVYRCGL